MFQKFAVNEYYYQRKLEIKILECLRQQNPAENLSVTVFICGGKNYFCAQDSTKNSKIVYDSDLQEMINFCSDCISGCKNCTRDHIFEPQDVLYVEEQIRKNLLRIFQSGNIQIKNDSFAELSELAEDYILIELPYIWNLGQYIENNSKYEYNSYVKFIVKTSLLCDRILDYIKYNIKVVADRTYEEELIDYKEKMKELLRWKNPLMIYELDLSKRSVYLLLRANVLTVQELRELQEEVLLNIEGIGKKSLQEIIQMRELL